MTEEQMEAAIEEMRGLGLLRSEADATRMRERWRTLAQLGPVAASALKLEGERNDDKLEIIDILWTYSDANTRRTLPELYEIASEADRQRVDTLLNGLSFGELFA